MCFGTNSFLLFLFEYFDREDKNLEASLFQTNEKRKVAFYSLHNETHQIYFMHLLLTANTQKSTSFIFQKHCQFGISNTQKIKTYICLKIQRWS